MLAPDFQKIKRRGMHNRPRQLSIKRETRELEYGLIYK
jgi:hypothetical protein